jgi:hypothetical protein
MDEVALPLLGGCFCGAVRYRVAGAPLMVHVCHCHRCQKRSGAAFALMVLVHTADLAVEGRPRSERRVLANGREVVDSACPACAAFVCASATAAPAYTTLRGGTLDDTRWLRPIAQTWVESAIPWALIPGVDQVDPDRLDYYALGAAWRATAPRFVGP